MITCQFCQANSHNSYLYLACGHLCCLPCAFMRADFSAQELVCCGQATPISDDTL